MNEGSTKTCTACKTARPLADFTRNRRKSDGYATRCRECQNAGRRAYRASLAEAGLLYKPKRTEGQRGCDVPDCEYRHYGHGWCEEHHRNWKDRGDPLAYPTRVNGGPCDVEECPETATSCGWCASHYKSWRKYGDPRIRRREMIPNNGRCGFDGCPEVPPGKTSKYCKKHYKRWRKHGDPSIALLDLTKYEMCQYCGVPTAGPRYCSKLCSSRHRFGVPMFTVCRTCGTSFPSWMHRQACSDHCRLELKRAAGRRTARRAPLTNPRFREHVKRHNLTRKARRLAALVETFSPLEIHQRDNWTCGICREPIDPSLRWPDRWCATIDHKIPFARGGRHERANVQSAHLSCNCSKQARLPDEIAS